MDTIDEKIIAVVRACPGLSVGELCTAMDKHRKHATIKNRLRLLEIGKIVRVVRSRPGIKAKIYLVEE